MSSDRDQRKLRAYARGFRKRNGQSPTTGTVHAVAVLAEWLGVQISLPRPACGTGIGGATGNAMLPTTENVTCLRCLSSSRARKLATHRPEPEQLMLGAE